MKSKIHIYKTNSKDSISYKFYIFFENIFENENDVENLELYFDYDISKPLKRITSNYLNSVGHINTNMIPYEELTESDMVLIGFDLITALIEDIYKKKENYRKFSTSLKQLYMYERAIDMLLTYRKGYKC